MYVCVTQFILPSFPPHSIWHPWKYRYLGIFKVTFYGMVEKIAFNGDKRVGFWKKGDFAHPPLHPPIHHMHLCTRVLTLECVKPESNICH